MSTTTPELRRGDVVLVAFPFVAASRVQRKLRPAVVVQSDRYNGRRNAIILAAITSAQASRHLPSKVAVSKDSPEGRQAGLRIDSVVDCQTLVTIPREEIVRRLGRFPPAIAGRIDTALQDALGLPSGVRPSG
jgi:mRNA interferase MazF